MPRNASQEAPLSYPAWKLFLLVGELGSLTKAANAMNTTQPHISRQIGELERECGGRLFERTGRGMVLTDLGQRIAPQIRKWIADTDQLTNDIRATAGTPVGTVRLGILPSMAHPLVSSLYYQLKAEFPLVQLAVREGQGAQLETLLEAGDVDLALLYRHGATPQHGDIYLARAPTLLVSAPGNPLTEAGTIAFRELDRLPLVMFCRPNSWRSKLDQMAADLGITLNVAAEADSLALQMQIVSDGGIYALLGPYAISSAFAVPRLQSSRVIDPEVPRYLALAMSPHGQLTLACRAVMKQIQKIAKVTATAALL